VIWENINHDQLRKLAKIEDEQCQKEAAINTIPNKEKKQ
jgi:hypothetical protein